MKLSKRVQTAMRQAAKAAGQRQLSGIDSMFHPFATKYEPAPTFEANVPWHCRHGILMFRPCSRCGRNRELADAVWGRRINQLLTQANRK